MFNDVFAPKYWRLEGQLELNYSFQLPTYTLNFVHKCIVIMA